MFSHLPVASLRRLHERHRLRQRALQYVKLGVRHVFGNGEHVRGLHRDGGTGGFNEDVETADLLQQYEARIAALERLVGKQGLELEFLKGALKSAPPPKSASTSAIAGPRVSASLKDAG
jgi:hypothetical protein